MSELTTLTRLLAYDRAVFERYLRSAERRGWKAAISNRETGHLSIKNTLVHILNVHEAWLVAVAQHRWEIFDAPGRRGEEVRSWADLRRYRDRVWKGQDELLAHLSEAHLRRRVTAPWMPGGYTLADAFYQISFEQAHHLGEIIGVYWQADWSPPPMTWIENRPRGGRVR
jgi:uncharacterized damage-inducible protein DinB